MPLLTHSWFILSWTLAEPWFAPFSIFSTLLGGCIINQLIKIVFLKVFNLNKKKNTNGETLTLNEREKLLMFDLVALHVDLQCEQQSEEKLVLFVETPRRVLIHLKGHELYDVGDPFAGDGAFGGSV